MPSCSVDSFECLRKILQVAIATSAVFLRHGNELTLQRGMFCFNHASAFYTSNNVAIDVTQQATGASDPDLHIEHVLIDYSSDNPCLLTEVSVAAISPRVAFVCARAGMTIHVIARLRQQLCV